MPLLLPLAAVITTALTVQTVNGTMKKIEKKRARKARKENRV